MPAAPRENVAFTVVVTVAVALGAAVVVLLLATKDAPATMFLATVLAAVPVGPVVAAYVWLDRYEPEPKKLLALGLLWGAFAATTIALLVEGIGGIVTGISTAGQASIIAPIAEEACKGLFLVLLLWWRRAEIDGVLDGIVYAGMVGVGFAFTENILYLASSYDGADGMGPGGLNGVTATFVVRCVFGPFAHPVFTAFTGIGIGLAVTSRSAAVRWLAPIGGYVLAVIAHGIWNGSTAFGFGSFVMMYAVLAIPVFSALISLAIWARSSERTVLTRALEDAAHRGLIPATDIGWVVDLRARRTARRFARSQGGPEALRAMRDYQQAAVELGFLHHRLLRGTPPRDWQVRGQVFLGLIQASRPRFAFPGQVVPQR
ncbi:PrsW family intramembrane metalloprotease [Nocardioides montaniterrae]